MTFCDPNPGFKVTAFFETKYLTQSLTETGRAGLSASAELLVYVMP